MKNLTFYRCPRCGNVIVRLSGKLDPTCCGEKMEKLVPNTVDAAVEKHLPVVKMTKTALTVSVGSTPHPMTKEHNISFVVVEGDHGFVLHNLDIDKPPVAKFHNADNPKAVYAYCNLHGLWMTKI